MTASTLIVVAKAPAAGRSKTRLCPPCTPEQAADLAAAALADTLAAVTATPHVTRRVLVLDGEPGPWLPSGVEVLEQRGDGLDERLAAAFDDVGAPAFLIGMDTPQVTPGLLRAGLDGLGDAASSFGPARDGGYWGIGLRDPDARVFTGVRMSAGDTGRRQLLRLARLGLSCARLPELRDVDRIEDAVAVAARAPHTRFARALRSLASAVAA